MSDDDQNELITIIPCDKNKEKINSNKHLLSIQWEPDIILDNFCT